MKTKSLVVLQALVALTLTVSVSARAEHAEEGAPEAEVSSRPGAAEGSQGFYDAISASIKAVEKEVKFKNDLSKTVQISKKDLDGQISTWVANIRDTQLKIVKECKDKNAATQLDELIRDYVSELSTQITKSNADIPQDTLFASTERKVELKSLYAITEAIRQVFAAEAKKKGANKKEIAKRRDELLKMLDKTNEKFAGVARKKLPKDFKDLKLEEFSFVAASGQGSVEVTNDGKRTLKTVVEEAAKSEGDACLFAVKTTDQRSDGSSSRAEVAEVDTEIELDIEEGEDKTKDKDEKGDKKTAQADALKEMQAKLDAEKKASEAAKAQHAAELKKEQDRIAALQKNFTSVPAQGGNKTPGGTTSEQAPGGQGGAPGGDAGGGGGSSSTNPDPAQTGFADLNGFQGNGLNGSLGDTLALQDQLRRDFEDQLAERDAEEAFRLAQLQQLQPPAFNSKSVSPGAPAAPSPLPPIPPVNVGSGGQGYPPGYPPVQPPMPQPMMPMMPPPQPMGPPTPVAFKTETTETREEGFVPSQATSMIQPTQGLLPPPQPPTIVNDVTVTVRMPDGTVRVMPMSQAQQTSGATILGTNNTLGTNTFGTVLTNSGVATTAGTSNVSGLAGAIQSLDTTGRGTGYTNSATSDTSSNINSANPNGQRSKLQF